ncbi:MAG: hypothetical protein AB1797_00370 [bacterium]
MTKSNSEKGMVLIVVVVSIAILAILALGYTFLFTSELKRTEFDEKLVHTLPVAEGGADRAEWRLENDPDFWYKIVHGAGSDSFTIVGEDDTYSCTVAVIVERK